MYNVCTSYIRLGGRMKGRIGLLRSPDDPTYLNPGSWTPGYGCSDRAAVGGGIGLLRSPKNQHISLTGVVDPGLRAFGPRCGRGGRRDLIYKDGEGD